VGERSQPAGRMPGLPGRQIDDEMTLTMIGLLSQICVQFHNPFTPFYVRNVMLISDLNNIYLLFFPIQVISKSFANQESKITYLIVTIVTCPGDLVVIE